MPKQNDTTYDDHGSPGGGGNIDWDPLSLFYEGRSDTPNAVRNILADLHNVVEEICGPLEIDFSGDQMSAPFAGNVWQGKDSPGVLANTVVAPSNAVLP
ncbi:MAG TPA: hypothetical protein V6D17_17465 [Candidatus Obscuribacterales bacterium]